MRLLCGFPGWRTPRPVRMLVTAESPAAIAQLRPRFGRRRPEALTISGCFERDVGRFAQIAREIVKLGHR